MKQFIIWYRYDGEEDFMIITAENEDDARRKFYGWHAEPIVEMHEVEDNERYLAYC